MAAATMQSTAHNIGSNFLFSVSWLQKKQFQHTNERTCVMNCLIGRLISSDRSHDLQCVGVHGADGGTGSILHHAKLLISKLLICDTMALPQPSFSTQLLLLFMYSFCNPSFFVFPFSIYPSSSPSFFPFFPSDSTAHCYTLSSNLLFHWC